MSQRTISDLSAAIKELAGRPELALLERQLDQLADLSACCADLRFAHDCISSLDALIGSSRGDGHYLEQTAQTALLWTAVNFYVRATGLSSRRGERGSAKIEGQLSEQQLKDHKAIVEARHVGLTHVTPNAPDTAGEIWSRQRPIAIEDEDGWQIAILTLGIRYRTDLLHRLATLVPVALKILTDRFDERTNMLGLALRTVPDWGTVLRKHLVDPAEVFGSREAALRALEPIYGGATISTYFDDDLPN